VLNSRAGVVTFQKGQLVQVYRNDLMNTLSTERKLLPTWSGPFRILEQLLNAYKLEELDGTPKPGEFSARRLRLFTPREGTDLARQQRELEVKLATERGGIGDTLGNTEATYEVSFEESPEIGEESGGDEDEPEGDPETVSISIADRVVGRRGRRQEEGGGWNR